MSPRTRLLALAGGLMQALVAAGILFLPVFATCYQNEAACHYQSYVQMGGGPLGYALLISMLGTGLLVSVYSVSRADAPPSRALWLAVILSFVTVTLGSWSIGLAFLPGAALLLIAVLAARRQPQSDV